MCDSTAAPTAIRQFDQGKLVSLWAYGCAARLDHASIEEDDAARKREERSIRSAARQNRLQHRLAQEAATLGAAMTVAATVDDPVAVETAPLVDETPSAKLLRAPSAKLLRAQTRITELTSREIFTILYRNNHVRFNSSPNSHSTIRPRKAR